MFLKPAIPKTIKTLNPTRAYQLLEPTMKPGISKTSNPGQHTRNIELDNNWKQTRNKIALGTRGASHILRSAGDLEQVLGGFSVGFRVSGFRVSVVAP